MPQRKPVDLIRELAPRFGIDPRAALAVAMGEGGLVNRPGSADIGDEAGGGSYGPFQLYAQGALPRQYVGNQAVADAWAWSPAGIAYALRKMAEAGARGLTGEAAVEAIVRRFERPAKPDASVAAALGRLGSLGGGDPSESAYAVPGTANGNSVMAGAAAPAPDGKREFALNLLSAIRGGKLDTAGLIGAVQAKRAAAPLAADITGQTPDIPAAPSVQPQPQAGYTTAGYTTTDALLARLGLADAVTSGDRTPEKNQEVGGSPTSFHLIPGRARDVDPSHANFPKLVALAARQPGLFEEFIFDNARLPDGRYFYVDKGRIIIGRHGGHGDHGHVVLR